jgi:hypothetical protein
MKMITKVFLVIAVLLACLIVWQLTLGEKGLIPAAWDGVADMVNTTWKSMTGGEDIMPDSKALQSVSEAQGQRTGGASTTGGSTDGN